MVKFVSITGGSPEVDFESAVLQGKARDGGLFVPTELPNITVNLLESWRGLTFEQLAVEILSQFIGPEIIPLNDLKRIIRSSYKSFSIPQIVCHHPFSHYPQLIIQELFHGPTLSFKDMAMGFVVNLFDYFLQKSNSHVNLLVATSGDTGPAAAFASLGKSHLDTWLLYPEGMITEEQRRQMTTLNATNVHSVGVRGCPNGSDDLDDLISFLFGNETVRTEMNISSVNSINWARVMMQTVHFFYGYLAHATTIGDPVNFAVPCGAFGNMCAGTIAQRMGLPVGQFIVASNANGVLSQAFSTGVLARRTVKPTYASAIDIAVPMNFWRHVYFSLGKDPAILSAFLNEYEEQGVIQFNPDYKKDIGYGMRSEKIEDEAIIAVIRQMFQEEHYLLDPHGAVAVAAALRQKDALSGPIICLATAHPAKFPGAIYDALGDVPIKGKHPGIEEAKQMRENTHVLKAKQMHAELPELIRKAKHTGLG